VAFAALGPLTVERCGVADFHTGRKTMFATKETKQEKRASTPAVGLRQRLVDKVEAGRRSYTRQREIIDAIEAKVGQLSLSTFARIQVGLNLEGTAKLRDSEVLQLVAEHSSLSDAVNDGMLAERELRERPPGWLVARRAALVDSIREAEDRIVRSRAELDQLAEQVMEVDPQPAASD
jgi:hypothetical protein